VFYTAWQQELIILATVSSTAEYTNGFAPGIKFPVCHYFVTPFIIYDTFFKVMVIL